MNREKPTKNWRFCYLDEFLRFFNRFRHNTINIPIFCMSSIALFVVAIYNIYNIYSEKDAFNGLYESERSSGKMGDHSTPGTGALFSGHNTGRCSVWGYLGNT